MLYLPHLLVISSSSPFQYLTLLFDTFIVMIIFSHACSSRLHGLNLHLKTLSAIGILRPQFIVRHIHCPDCVPTFPCSTHSLSGPCLLILLFDTFVVMTVSSCSTHSLSWPCPLNNPISDSMGFSNHYPIRPMFVSKHFPHDLKGVSINQSITFWITQLFFHSSS